MTWTSRPGNGMGGYGRGSVTINIGVWLTMSGRIGRNIVGGGVSIAESAGVIAEARCGKSWFDNGVVSGGYTGVGGR